MIKFNMGCGHNRKDGYLNVDAFHHVAPDEVWDLETTPWPWPDSCASEVLFFHSLEHMGQDPRVFLAIMSELYRICAPGAQVAIRAPHPRHDHFLTDPTHVRPITAATLRLFDIAVNDRIKAAGASSTTLAQYLGVDFAVTFEQQVMDPRIEARVQANELTLEQVAELARRENNVLVEERVILTVHKPPRGSRSGGDAALDAPKERPGEA